MYYEIKYCPNCGKAELVVIGITGDGTIYQCNACKFRVVIMY